MVHLGCEKDFKKGTKLLFYFFAPKKSCVAFQLTDEVEELCLAVEQAETAHVKERLQLKHFEGTDYWKYRLGKKRLLARFRQHQGEEVLCLLTVLERKGHEYKEFLKDKRG